MKFITLLIALSILLGGCSRKSELEEARENLAEAQRKIDALENERVPREQYDNTRASLKIADARIAALERELKTALEKVTAQNKMSSPGDHANEAETNASEKPTGLSLKKGAFVVANETNVYDADAQLNFGRHLQISSPTGLMVSDPELKIVGGDLTIKAKDMMIESSDGLLTTEADGSVKFIGKTLKMTFNDKKSASEIPSATVAPSNANATEELPPATPTPAATNSP